MNKEWSGKPSGSTFSQKSLMLYLRHGSISLAYLVMSFSIILFIIFSAKATRSIYHYFRLIHSFSRFKSIWMTYKNYYQFGQSLVDRFALFAGRSDKYNMDIPANKQFEDALNSEKGMIIISSHCGNFEIAGFLIYQEKKRINAIVFGGESDLYQEARMKSLSNNNIFLIPVKEDMSHVYSINESLQKGEILIIPGDRIFDHSRYSDRLFLGKMAKFPLGPHYLASKYNVNVFSVFVMKESKFHYKPIVHSHNPADKNQLSQIEKVEAFISSYVNHFENIVRQYPTQWYNFYRYWN
jgi:predicted LPLAT superfamily acyltransferase